MEVLLTALVSAAVAAAVVLLAFRLRGPVPAAARVPGSEDSRRPTRVSAAGAATPARPAPAGSDPPAEGQADPGAEPEPGIAAGSGRGAGAPAEAGTPAEAGSAADAELRARREELARREERLLAKESRLDARLTELDARERSLEDRARNLDAGAARLKEARREQLRELERLAGLSAGQARQAYLRELEDELRAESARLIRQVEEETRQDADRRARSILATCMQRVAGGHSSETTVSTVELKSDELKGRIIGREGRNIRTLETLTGIDFIVDDTPNAVVLSGFDGVRREIARLTLERLLQDGRIHPARIEEAYAAAKGDVERRMAELGEQAALEASAGTLHPELLKLLGRMHYRTSYGQNVLHHSVECARLAGLLAGELGAGAKVAARAALLHDIGKAVSHEIEGPHALVGGRLARRYGESEAVAHAMEAHHNEVDPRTVEAVIVQIVDSASGARPGARGESLEHYVSRLRELEELAARHAGVEKVYAMHAGREVRVIVKPEEVDDDGAALLSRRIARAVESNLEYPGQIKVTVIRESRSTDFAT